jgi:hypothetical protein
MKLTKTQLKQIIKEELESVLKEKDGETPQDVATRMLNLPASIRGDALGDLEAMAAGDDYALGEFGSYYPHIPREGLPAFAQQVLDLVR